MKLFHKSVTVIYPCNFQANRTAGMHETGRALAYLSGIPDGARVQMRVKMGQIVWQSTFASIDRIALRKKES
jgi:hypothetical protein